MPNRSYSKIMLKKKPSPKVGGEVTVVRKYNGEKKYNDIKAEAAKDKAARKYPKIYPNSQGSPLSEREKAARKNYPTVPIKRK